MVEVACTLLRWTGRGKISDLHNSVAGILAGRKGARVTRVGATIVVRGVEPASIARRFAHLPGLDWIAIGYTSKGGAKEVADSAAILATRYLKKGLTFKVQAEATASRYVSSDVAGIVAGKLLGTSKGVKIDERSPDVSFRAVLDGKLGAVGVELSAGEGGAPTSARLQSYCLVSGGMHSAVVAWMASLAGYSVELVHAPVGRESILEVARLYAELSNRVDPRYLRLSLLGAGKNVTPAGMISGWLAMKGPKPVFSGLHAECRKEGVPQTDSDVISPLMVMPEREFERVHRSLGVGDLPRRDDSLSLRRRPGEGPIGVRSFGGVAADVHEVLDTILSR